jgi:hypothetical protein
MAAESEPAEPGGAGERLIRAELGPTLPALVRRRFGVPPLVTIAVAAVAGTVALVVIVAAITGSKAPGEEVVHERAPVFNVLHPEGIEPVRTRAGELMRLEGRRGKLSVSVVVRPLELPRYDGDVTHGLLPVYAHGFAEARRRLLPGFKLVAEGRARVNNAVGYEIGFQSVRRRDRTYGRDVLLVPDDPGEAKGFVSLSLRQHKPGGPFTAAERGFAFAARKVYRSFRYGTGRG